MAFDVAVLTFPGSNCDADLRWAVDNTPELSARAVCLFVCIIFLTHSI